MFDLYIVGCGGLGREAAWVIERLNKANRSWKIRGFIDDNLELKDQIVNGIPVISGVDDFIGLISDAFYVIAIADPVIRKKIVDKFKYCKGLHPATLIDPSVILSDTVEVGEGSIILPGCVISVDVKLDRFVIVNYSTTIGHDCKIGSYSTIYPGAHLAGNVTLKSGCQVGTGAVILQGLTIESDAFIGGQGAVIDSVSEPGIYVGVPVRKVSKRN